MKIYRTILMIFLLYLFSNISSGYVSQQNFFEEKEMFIHDRNILIICQDNLELYQEYLPEISPKKLFFITEKKSHSSFSSEYYGHVSRVDDYFNSGEVEFEAFKLYQKNPYYFIIAPSETDILRAGKLRTLLKLPGQSYESALIFRDKILMKQQLQHSNIIVPFFSKVCSALDVLSFVQSSSFPVIIKPCCGYGAVRTFLIKNDLELENFIKKPNVFGEFHNSDLEIEQYIDAEMYHIDGLVQNGAIVVSWPSRCINTCLDMTRNKPTGGYLLSAENPLTSELKAYTKKILNILPTPENTGFHLEVFYHKKKIIFCEIASRIGGPWVNDLWIHGININLKKEFIRSQAFLKPSITLIDQQPFDCVGGMIFPPQEGYVLSIAPMCPLSEIIYYSPYVQIGENLSFSNGMLDHIAFCMFKTGNENEMQLFISIITKWFYKNFIVEKFSHKLK